MVRLAFVAGGLVLALDVLGATALIGTVLGAAGLVGLAIGFAVRDTIENYIASIMLSLRQPFQPNDHVRIEGWEGLVIRLTARAAILMTLDGNHVRIPNATVFKAAILNDTRNPQRRFEFRLGVAAEANLARAVEIGLGALRDLPFVLRDPEPMGWTEDVGDSSITLWFGARVDQTTAGFAQARGEAIRMVELALEENGIDLPEPSYRVHLEQAPAPGAAAADAPQPARPLEIQPVTQISDKVAAERAEGRGPDLLDPRAPQE